MISEKNTFLFDRIIFGPIQSRRLGNSLGINLLPATSKLCNMDCIYCECGMTVPNHKRMEFPSADDVLSSLRSTLSDFQLRGIMPDSLTFAGNGEPTMHPDFPEIIRETIRIRDSICPGAKVAVLTNSMLLHKPEVREALLLADLRIFKLDAGTDEMFQRINQPHSSRKLKELVASLKKFNGNLIIQSLFVRGLVSNEPLDNSADCHVSGWINCLAEIRPRLVMIYTIDRATPEKDLLKVSRERMQEIASRVNTIGIETTVY